MMTCQRLFVPRSSIFGNCGRILSGTPCLRQRPLQHWACTTLHPCWKERALSMLAALLQTIMSGNTVGNWGTFQKMKKAGLTPKSRLLPCLCGESFFAVEQSHYDVIRPIQSTQCLHSLHIPGRYRQHFRSMTLSQCCSFRAEKTLLDPRAQKGRLSGSPPNRLYASYRCH